VFDPIYNFFGAILAALYGLIPNLGVAIILLTVLVMLALFPLTAKQAKAMMAMQRAQPEIKKLQAKYKGDRAKLNEEMMKFYQENKINPLAGCLPLVVQLPIFFSLFRVMRQPYQHVPTSSSLYHAFCGNASVHACGQAPLPHHLDFLGMDLAQSATGVSGGFLVALPYFLLVGAVIVTGFLQGRQAKRNAPNMTSQMALIQNVLPIGFGVISLQFPAGLVLYFLVSNIWRLGQQELIMRKITGPAAAIAGGGAIDVKSSEKGPDAPPSGLRRLFQLPQAPNGETDRPNGNGAPERPPSGAKPGSTSGPSRGDQRGGKPAAGSGPAPRRPKRRRRR
jgi:YidC/Oxa1 family membrane protein insertase